MNRTSRRNAAVLGAIILLGLFLRSYHLGERGLLFYDEGTYYYGAQVLADAGTTLATAFRLVVENRLMHKESAAGPARAAIDAYSKRRASALDLAIFPKPVHYGLLAGVLLAIGPKPLYGLCLSVLFSCFTILLTFLIGRRVSGSDSQALLAALFLSVSSLDVALARSALAESDSLFFFQLSFLMYCLSVDRPNRETWYLAAAGLSAALSFGCNSRWLIVPVILVLAEAAPASDARGLARRLRRSLLFCVAFGVSMCLFEVPYYVMVLVERALGLSMGINTYVEGLYGAFLHSFRAMYGEVAPFSLWNVVKSLTFTYYYYEGSVFLLLVALAIRGCLKRLNLAANAIMSTVLLTFLYYSAGFYYYDRFLSLATPALCILAADGTFALCGWLERVRPIPKRLTLAAALAVIAPVAVARSLRCASWKSGFAQVAASINSAYSDYGVLSTNPTVHGFYLGYQRVRRVPESVEEFERRPLGGKWLLALDIHRFGARHQQRGVGALTKQGPAALGLIGENCWPILTAANTLNRHFFIQYALSCNMIFDNTKTFVDNLDVAQASVIEVFDLACLRPARDDEGER